MTKTTPNKKPDLTFRDGPIKAAVWWNPSEKSPKGGFHSVRFTRTWKDEQGNYHDSDSFSGRDLLRLSNLSANLYSRLHISDHHGCSKEAAIDAEKSVDSE